MPGPRRYSFRRVAADSSVPESPEALFGDLKDRDPRIESLWSHQADILRTYRSQHLESPNVAFQLPTGAGKTLVGLLVAEYCRKARGERVVYLCPTRQLANQVAQQARDYKIAAVSCLAPTYNNILDYQQSQAIAVTTYSALFNTKPRFGDPNVILLDDAHAAEELIASLWTVEIRREAKNDLYLALLDIFADVFDAATIEELRESTPSHAASRFIDLVPQPVVADRAEKVLSTLREHAAEDDRYTYPLGMVREHLSACLILFSYGRVEISPLVPPTLTHEPFHAARQRIYMSATLGDSGELERIAGVQRIERIPLPSGWETRTNGRRLFLAPGAALSESEALAVAVKAAKTVGRSLILVPRKIDAEVIEGGLRQEKLTVLHAEDVENDLAPFTKNPAAALVLANRYDGLDLPGEDCRLVLLIRLPAGAGLMERFFLNKLAASHLVRDRIRTRLTQGVGRCCRSASDYSAVLLIGPQLIDFCSKTDIRAGLHPELQAEIEFGLANSRDLPPEGFEQLLSDFLARGDDWKAAEAEILSLRRGKARVIDAAASSLAASVKHEVQFAYALWTGSYENAIGHARAASDLLGGPKLASYRAFWNYLEAVAHWFAAKNDRTGNHSAQVTDCLKRSIDATPVLRWFATAASAFGGQMLATPVDAADQAQLDGILAWLNDAGWHGKGFERQVEEMLQLLRDENHDRFVHGLELLGASLGFESTRPKSPSAPDAIWRLGAILGYAIEAKVENEPHSVFGVNTVRQVISHASWAKANLKIPEGADVKNALVGGQRPLDREGATVPHFEEALFWEIDDIRDLGAEAIATLRTIRAQAQNGEDAELRANAYATLKAQRLNAVSLADRLGATKLRELLPRE